MSESYLNGRVTLHTGDMLAVLPTLPAESIDAVVCDPPYGLSFMGKAWDHGVPSALMWVEVLRVLKPGGHLLAFAGTRTQHRMACAIEDAGFEIRDMVAWVYGAGFPKSHNVSVSIDKLLGAEREVIGVKSAGRSSLQRVNRVQQGYRPNLTACNTSDISVTAPATDTARQWEGWGTALKPALEPITFARKPLQGTVAANVLAHGTGALNIDGCRVGLEGIQEHWANYKPNGKIGFGGGEGERVGGAYNAAGRWPANLIHDGSDEVVAAFPETGAAKSGGRSTGRNFGPGGEVSTKDRERTGHDDAGGTAARFFYSSKADGDDRIGSKHPTVKPVDLMQYLVRLVTPPGGTVLDPFAGTGTTGEAAFREGMRAVLIEREPEYQADIRRRMALCLAGPDERRRETIKAKGRADDLTGTLFALTGSAA